MLHSFLFFLASLLLQMIKALICRCQYSKFHILKILQVFGSFTLNILHFSNQLIWLGCHSHPKPECLVKMLQVYHPYICINWVDSFVFQEDENISNILEFQSKCNSSNLGAAVYCASNVTPNVIYQMLSTRKFNCYLWNIHHTGFFHFFITAVCPYCQEYMFGWTVVQSFRRAKMTDGNTF